ncbi:MAG: sugar transferase [Ignavibacteriales bacterium]
MKPKGYLITKRVIDIMISLPAVIILIPVLLILCILIVIDSAGSPFFVQDRVGLNGKIFKMFKLRTMYIGSDRTAEVHTEENDPRITRFGRFLRRTSLDEIPQFLNILLGHMTLVGWRPELPIIVEQFSQEQKELIYYKPGLTGWGQINGRHDIPWQEKAPLDLEYCKSATLKSDFMIMLNTFTVIFSNKGNR